MSYVSSKASSMRTRYNISVKTSDGYKTAGSNSTVEAQFVGENGAITEWVVLDSLFRDNNEKGSTDNFDVEMEDVGIPSIIRFKVTGTPFGVNRWICDYVIVKRGSESKFFPINSPIGVPQRFVS